AMHRPGRFRMRADTALSAGPELDLGSNDALFWFWYRGDAGNVYFCPHDRFATSEAARVVPIAPAELIDAMGLATLDPAMPHQGPFARPDGMLEIRTIRDTIDGPITKITVVHPYGWIVEQHFHNASGQTVFRAIGQQHRRDPASGLIMPRMVDVDSPPSGFRMRIDLGNVEINTVPDGPLALWEMPQYAGARLVDLSDPNLRFQQTSASRVVTPPVATGTTTAAPTHAPTWRQLSR
ncbi:MAG: hypothetical protein GX621_04450, partial [Pirellulaceae bacterium]|nr:hypothetical protein [Pirellulaceae bacterium]